MRQRGTFLALIVVATCGPASLAQTQATWLGGSSTSWVDAANWSTAPYYPNKDLPTGATYDVFIADAGSTAITMPTSSVISLQSLAIGNAGLLCNGGILSLVNAFAVTGSVNFNCEQNQGFIHAPTLSGNGALNLSSTGTGSVTLRGTPYLTIQPGTTLAANTGSIYLGTSVTAFTNQGTILITGGITRIRPAQFQNTGTIVVQGGTLALQTWATLADISNIHRVGGSLFMSGTLDLAGGSFDTAGWTLSGATLSSGRLFSSLGSVNIATSAFGVSTRFGGGTLGSANISQTLSVGTHVFLDNATIAVNSGSIRTNGNLNGAGTILLDNSGLSGTTISCSTGTNVYIGTAGAGTSSVGTLASYGTIDCRAAGTTLNLASLDNRGTVILSDGTINWNLTGPSDTCVARMGNFTRTGGTLIVSGLMTNTDRTFSADTFGTPVAFRGFAVSGGTLAGSSFQLAPLNGLSNVSLSNCSVAVPINLSPGDSLGMWSSSLANSSITLDGAKIEGNTIAGNGTIVAQGSSQLRVSKIDAGLTVLAGGNFTLAPNSSGSMTNNGKVLINTPGGWGDLRSVLNNGTIMVGNASTLYMSNVTNNGRISVDGGSIVLGSNTGTFVSGLQLSNAYVDSGALTNQSYTFRIDATNTYKLASVNGGTLEAAGGTLIFGYGQHVGITLKGDFNLLSPVDSVNFRDILTLQDSSVRAPATLYFDGHASGIMGAGTLLFNRSHQSLYFVSGSVTIGRGVSLNSVASRLYVYTDTHFINEGLLRVSGKNKVLLLAAGSLTNNGRVEVQDSAVFELEHYGKPFINNGTIDLAGGMMMTYSLPPQSLAFIRQQITNGYNGGSWNSPGIMSSLAAQNADLGIGFAEASAIFSSYPATFYGQEVDSTTVLAALTLLGDINLDSTVDSTDLTRFMSTYGNQSGLWTDGDFNYDGQVNALDLSLLNANFGKTFVVPEPTGLVASATMLLGVGRRRKR